MGNICEGFHGEEVFRIRRSGSFALWTAAPEDLLAVTEGRGIPLPGPNSEGRKGSFSHWREEKLF
jgi:hypothetical protein